MLNMGGMGTLSGLPTSTEHPRKGSGDLPPEVLFDT